MYLFEYLIHLLRTHAEVLSTFPGLYGMKPTLALLEKSAENASEIDEPVPEVLRSSRENVWVLNSVLTDADAYGDIQSAVERFTIAPELEFYLWTYPLYRAIVESDTPLCLELKRESQKQTVLALIEEAKQEALNWYESLPLPPDYRVPFAQIFESPYAKLRSTLLKTIGEAPLKSL